MPDHDYYEGLAALAAGGHLSEAEEGELRTHLEECRVCRASADAYLDLVDGGLPLARHAGTMATDLSSAARESDLRQRFVARARRDGIKLSAEVDEPLTAAPAPSSFRARGAWLAVAAALIAAAAIAPLVSRLLPQRASSEEVDRLRRENAQLGQQLTSRDQDLARQQEQLRALRTELDTAVTATDGLRRQMQLPGFRLGQSTSQEARLLEELQNRDRQLTEASEEIRRINQLRVSDRSELEQRRGRLRDVLNQLRIANATIEMEREFAAAGRDILQLMLARQLRVVDVRDTDASGRPGTAFARVFAAEGLAIRIFAFDLDEGSGAPRRFQVWGERQGSTAGARNLGSLTVDDRTQNRWSLSIQNTPAIANIDSVFVTATTQTTVPEGPRLLYAFLGGTVQ